ncbi:MAG: hypothetical protein LUQ69_02080 [Methanoregulaceae archaeon]|nr:hypothetical protein [Methanoregulaceae archaeon]
MKKGRKKIERDEAGNRKPESEEADSKKAGGDDSGTFKVTSDMIGGNPNGIDGLRALMILGGGIATVILFWLVLRNILHII